MKVSIDHSLVAPRFGAHGSPHVLAVHFSVAGRSHVREAQLNNGSALQRKTSYVVKTTDHTLFVKRSRFGGGVVIASCARAIHFEMSNGVANGEAVLPEPRERLKMLQYLLSSSLKDLSALKEDDLQVNDVVS